MKKLILIPMITLIAGCQVYDKCNFEKGYCKDFKEDSKQDASQNILIQELKDLITALRADLTQVSSNTSSLETDITNLTVRVTELESESEVIELIDPCGDKPGKFDEIIMRLSDDTLVAYFEETGREFLTILVPGNYQTTDAQRCNFTVTNDLQVVW